MKLKKGSNIMTLKPEMVLAFTIINNVYFRYNYDCVLTEGTGGKHMEKSLHYSGYAIDIRTKNILPVDKPVIIAGINVALNDQFDIILEDEGCENEHLHVEFDPY